MSANIVIHSCSPLIAYDVQQEWLRLQSVAARSGRPFVPPKVVAPSFGLPAQVPLGQKGQVASGSRGPVPSVASRVQTVLSKPIPPIGAGIPQRAGILTVEGEGHD